MKKDQLDREERLRRALRENLKKRKQQNRVRARADVREDEDGRTSD